MSAGVADGVPGSPGAIRRVAIIGAGAEGMSLAERAARAGYSVILEDLMPGKRREAARRLDGQGLGIVYAGSVEEAAREADLVVDFVPDELESKLEIFSLLDRMAPPHTIFATPTRVLSIADLASCTYRGERCVGLRFTGGWLEVEVVSPPQGAREVVGAVVAFWTSIGARVSVTMDEAALP